MFTWAERRKNERSEFRAQFFQADGESFTEWKLKKKHRLEGNKKTLRLSRCPPCRKSPSSLAPEEVERLKATASRPEFRDMRFSLSLMLYGGIRPTEVSRLQDGDINWEEGHVIIRPRASKTGGGRAVPLRSVRGIRKRERFIPRNWKRKWQALRRAAGFRHWVPDVCRHTFATYHAAMFRNLPELQLEMGHRDTSLLRSRYMVPASRKDAELFWKGCR